jgi:hypothetical protein
MTHIRQGVWHGPQSRGTSRYEAAARTELAKIFCAVALRQRISTFSTLGTLRDIRIGIIV